MTLQTLDFLIMWIAFIYGFTMFFILEIPWIKPLESRVPHLFLILRQHQPIAFLCLWVGGIWILQEIVLKV